MNQYSAQATVITQAELAPNRETMQLALFDEAGEPFVNGNSALAGAEPAAFQADSVAADTAAMVVDFNALLAKLVAAGLMEAS